MAIRFETLSAHWIFTPGNQHRNSIDNRIGATACIAEQARLFEEKCAEAGGAGQLIEDGRVEGVLCFGRGRHEA